MPDPPVMAEPLRVDSTDGVSIASYLMSAPGARQPELLLAHANGFCAAVFAPLVREMSGFKCVGFDARAHGRSGGSSGEMAWERHRDDLLAVNDAYGLAGSIGVGHSMGGAALLLAEQLRPGTFSALWLFEPIVFPPSGTAPDGENVLEAGARRRRDTFDSPRAAYANYASKPPLNQLCPESLSAYVHHGFDELDDGRITLACRPDDEAAGYRMGARHHAWDALGTVRCPVLIVRGRHDVPGPATVAPMIADRLPAGHLEDHGDLGHFGPLEDPLAMARSIRSFHDPT